MTEQANHHKIYIVDEEYQVSREASRGGTHGSITWEGAQGEEIREEKINLQSRGIDEPDGSYSSRRYNPVDNRVTLETKLDIDKPKEKIFISTSSEVGTVGGGGLGTNSSNRKPKIQRVPRVLRASRSDDRCYDPLIVSIGPYHYKNVKLQTMEKYKEAMMQHFVRQSLGRCDVQKVFHDVIDVLTEARECYDDPEDDDENFSNLERFQHIMFVDGCFLVQFILSKTTAGKNRSRMTVVHDALLVRDMFLLENQLPFSVIKRLMQLKYRDDTIIFYIIKSFINWAWPIRERQYQDSSEGMTMKCSAWCRYFSRVWRCRVEDGLDPFLSDNFPLWNMPQKPVHLLQAMQMRLIGPYSGVAVDDDDDDNESWYSYRWRSATELKAAGIKFRCGKSHQLYGMHFMKSPFCGILTMTPMRINDATEPILMNLVALEALPSDGVAADQLLVTSYIGFLDSLIDHAGDVKELRSKGIIDNALGSDEQVAHLFNRIGEGLSYNHKAFLNVQNAIDEHYKNRWKIWINQWLDAHFSSPWTILAFLGALFVVALSATQTYYTVYTPRDKT